MGTTGKTISQLESTVRVLELTCEDHGLENSRLREREESLMSDVQAYRALALEAVSTVSRLSAQLHSARERIVHWRTAYESVTGGPAGRRVPIGAIPSPRVDAALTVQ